MAMLGLLTRVGVIKWTSDIPLLGRLNQLSLTLAALAFLWSWLKDWRWLHAEEKDIAKLFADAATQRDPLKVLRPTRRVRGSLSVETLLDDRVRRALLTNDEEVSVRESELRAVAVWRSATIGSFARYASGLLLLFTVLGTFLGVKASLEPLQEALLRSSGPDAAASAALLAKPLGNVAEAFGSNLTALVGAITLGLAAWALSIGRQNMLARLEQSSSLYVYPKVKRTGPLHQLAGAAREIGKAGAGMSAAAAQLGGVRETIVNELSGVREALVDQLGTLGDSVGDFSASIDDSLKQTRHMLKALLEQQAAQVADESRRAVDKIERQITDTTVAVQQATTLYASMVGRLQQDVDTISHSSRTLSEALGELKQARESFGAYADSASRTLDNRLGALEESNRRQLVLSRRTYARYRRMDKSLLGLLAHAGALSTAIGEAEERRREALVALDERTAKEVQTLLEPSFQALRQSVEQLGNQLTQLPGAVGVAVATAMQERRAPPPSRQPEPTEPGRNSAVDLEATVARLASVLERIDDRASRPLWHRIIGKNSRRSR
jgi:hypothetical protein